MQRGPTAPPPRPTYSTLWSGGRLLAVALRTGGYAPCPPLPPPWPSVLLLCLGFLAK